MNWECVFSFSHFLVTGVLHVTAVSHKGNNGSCPIIYFIFIFRHQQRKLIFFFLSKLVIIYLSCSHDE